MWTGSSHYPTLANRKLAKILEMGKSQDQTFFSLNLFFTKKKKDMGKTNGRYSLRDPDISRALLALRSLSSVSETS